MTSKTWTKQLVLAEAAAWIWTPPSATVHRSTGVELVHYGNDGGFDPRAYVQDSERPAGELIAEVEQVISGWGPPDCYWQVFDTTRPANFEDELRRRGAKVVEETDVLARVLDEADLVVPELPEGLEVRLATDEQMIRDSFRVTGASFENRIEPSPERIRAALEDPAGGLDAEAGRVVAYLDGEPVGSGGWTALHGSGALLLWAGATAPGARGRGVYRAVLAERLRLGVLTTEVRHGRRVGWT